MAADCCFKDVTALVTTAQNAVVAAAARGTSSGTTGVAAAAPSRRGRTEERILNNSELGKAELVRHTSMENARGNDELMKKLVHLIETAHLLAACLEI